MLNKENDAVKHSSIEDINLEPEKFEGSPFEINQKDDSKTSKRKTSSNENDKVEEETTNSKKDKKGKKKEKLPKFDENGKKISFFKRHKKGVIISTIVFVLLTTGGAITAYILLNQKDETPVEDKQEDSTEPEKEHYYSLLTGEEIDDPKLNENPTYCMQIPNGADGARPQVGLNQAGVVFEAIAEGGITRFAAVFQNPKSSVIGPIRSLRTYYLEWDTPFDCTIVHAGGAPDALAAVASGGYRDLSESRTYMWRNYSGYYAPNNLFTSADLLAKFNSDNGFNKSELRAFPRLKPEDVKKVEEPSQDDSESDKDKTTIMDEDSKSSDQTSNTGSEKILPKAETISINFGSSISFNTVYNYDIATNTYKRSYATGEAHNVYQCEKEQANPKSDCGDPIQIAPSAVAAIMVDEYTKADKKHHENIQTSGSGVAYIFQNGTVIKGTWSKVDKYAQIEFKDEQGNIISFVPGQLWIAATPNRLGSVKY